MRFHSPDYIFLITVLVLVLFGAAMLLSASSPLGQKKFQDSYYFLKKQALRGFLLGAIGFLAGYFFYYRKLKSISLFLLLATIFLLILIFTPLGLSIKGAERWLSIGPFSFQPSEILKFTFLLYLAGWLSVSKEKKESLTVGFIPFLVIIGIIAALLALQPSLGLLAIIFASAAILYFLSGVRLSFLAVFIILIILAFFSLSLVIPNRFERITAFLYPQIDPQGEGYHLNQALIAIGSGGVFGKGFGNSITKLNSLPETIGDSIFAVISEELGFAGAIFLIGLYMLLMFRGLRISKHAPDQFGKLLSAGFVFLIITQAIVNISAICGLIPITGIPLPFISYGSSSLIVLLAMTGVIANISRYTTK